MYEKITDSQKRQEKVANTKSKIIKEIKQEINEIMPLLGTLINNYINNDTKESEEENKENKDTLFRMIYILNCLKKLEEYINREDSLQSYIKKVTDANVIIYNVSSELLDIILYPDFNFVRYFMYHLSDADYNADVYMMLNDIFFGNNFISAIDECIYLKKIYSNCESNKDKENKE